MTTATLDQLNEQFALAQQLVFQSGPSDLPLLHIHNEHAQAQISLYGAQILAFKPHSEAHDLLFVSEQARYQVGLPVRGGIPICWPWFGADPSQQGHPSHGFARLMVWTVIETRRLDNGETLIELGLDSSAATQAYTPQAFQLRAKFIIGETLTVTLSTTNTDTKPFTITQALHSYFNISAIAAIAIRGLQGVSYLDKTQNNQLQVQTEEPLRISGEVDRIYQNPPTSLWLEDAKHQRTLHIQAQHSRTAVVWNPWIEVAKRLSDLQDDDYLRFVCVETANVADDAITLAPQETAVLGVRYQLQPIA